MSYHCLYDVNNTKIATQITPQPCYRAVYSKLNQYSTIRVFVLKSYTGINCNSSMNRTKEEIYEYYNYLKEMQFNLELSEGTINKNDCYIFTIDITKNSIISVMIMLNLIRYLYENICKDVGNNFFELMRSDNAEPVFNKMLMAHFGPKVQYHGHNMASFQQIMFKLFDEKSWKNNVIDNKVKTVYETGQILLKTKAVLMAEVQNLQKLFVSDKNAFITKYKELNGK